MRELAIIEEAYEEYGGEQVSYQEAMNESNAWVFSLGTDQSSSMMERIQGQPDKWRKSEFIADAINRTITNLIVKATKGEPSLGDTTKSV